MKTRTRGGAADRTMDRRGGGNAENIDHDRERKTAMTRVLIATGFALVLATSTVLTGGTAHGLGEKVADDPPPVTESCRSNYEQSSASRTCSNEEFTKVMNYQCRINATCRVNNNETRRTWKTLDPADASRLVNCSGWLKVGNC